MYLHVPGMLECTVHGMRKRMCVLFPLYTYCLPLIAAHFEDCAPKLPLADLREVLNLPSELSVQPMRLRFCKRSVLASTQAEALTRVCKTATGARWRTLIIF